MCRVRPAKRRRGVQHKLSCNACWPSIATPVASLIDQGSWAIPMSFVRVALRAPGGISLLVASVLLASCSGGGQPQSVVTSSSRPVSAAQQPLPGGVLEFVGSTAAVGRTVVEDAAFGGWVEVTLEGQYYAASSRTCRRFTVRQVQEVAGVPSTEYACYADGRWARVKLD